MDKQALLGCWTMFSRKHGVSVDRTICDPQLRTAFLASVKKTSGSATEQEVLWALMGLRKRKDISKNSERKTDAVTKRVKEPDKVTTFNCRQNRGV